MSRGKLKRCKVSHMADENLDQVDEQLYNNVGTRCEDGFVDLYASLS